MGCRLSDRRRSRRRDVPPRGHSSSDQPASIDQTDPANSTGPLHPIEPADPAEAKDTDGEETGAQRVPFGAVEGDDGGAAAEGSDAGEADAESWDDDEEDEDYDPDVRPRRAPWHFKVLLVGTVIYLGWRAYQGITWLIHHV
jgi:hypothetical protein